MCHGSWSWEILVCREEKSQLLGGEGKIGQSRNHALHPTKVVQGSWSWAASSQRSSHNGRALDSATVVVVPCRHSYFSWDDDDDEHQELPMIAVVTCAAPPQLNPENATPPTKLL